ncbi:MAG TPA: hypothetical protein VGL29_13880, partial [Blastocatellia bacterium]
MGFLTFPVDAAFTRGRRDFDEVRQTLSDAYAVAALTYSYLGAPEVAGGLLASSRASDPALSERSPLWFLATAEIETDLNKKLLFLNKATELDSDFEIAQYRFAKVSEMRLRLRGEIRRERVEGVIQQYEEVLSINPGNIGASLAQGNLWWLLRDWDAAERKLNEGCDTKAIVRQTFVGEFLYGLARIAVEKGDLNGAYDLYGQAVFADPEVAAYSTIQSKNLIESRYDYITVDILERYEEFWRKAERAIREHIDSSNASKRKNSEKSEISERTLKNLRSFVSNDYGNACLNYYHRFGDLRILRKAIKAYVAAINDNRENFVAYYNLDNAYGWLDNAYAGIETHTERVKGPLEQAEKLAPAWPAVLIETAKRELRQAREAILKQNEEIETREKELVTETLKAVRRETEQRGLESDHAYGMELPQAMASPANSPAVSPAEPQVLIQSEKTSGPGSKPRTTDQVQDLISTLKKLHDDRQSSIKNFEEVILPKI